MPIYTRLSKRLAFITICNDGTAHFPRAAVPGPDELGPLLWTLITRITRTLLRAGVLVAEDEQPCLDLGDGLTLRATGRCGNTRRHCRRPSGWGRHHAPTDAVAGRRAERRATQILHHRPRWILAQLCRRLRMVVLKEGARHQM